MNSIVIELQREALNTSVSITDLLRKALIVARKLAITEFKEWIDLELKGYSDISQIPQYRMVRGQVKYFNPLYGGWTKIIIDDIQLAVELSKRNIYQPVGEIESLLKRDDTTPSFEMPFPPNLEISLRKVYDLPVIPSFFIDRGSCFRILESVRNIILEWTLKLEGNSILGEGMTFSREEKEAASTITYNIKNLFSQISHSQIQQETTCSLQSLFNTEIDMEKLKQLINLIKESVGNLDISEQSKSELTADIDTIQSQILSSKPKTSIIRECLHSIRNIFEGVAGNILAPHVIGLIDPFLR